MNKPSMRSATPTRLQTPTRLEWLALSKLASPGALVTAGLLSAVLVAVVLWADLALAHAIGLSRGEYRVLGRSIAARLVFDRDELASVLERGEGARALPVLLDSSAGRAELQRRIVQGVRVSERGGAPCPGTLQELTILADGGVVLDALYACGGEPEPAVVIEFWDVLSPGHRHLASSPKAAEAAGGTPGASEQLAYRAQPRVELTALAAPPSLSPSEWIALGVEHIVTGYDHLLFLLALVLVTPALRTLTATVSVFTLAHSVTLALSTLRVFAPPPGLIECAIALSITYVGLENLTPRAHQPRYFVVFAFGLIHGFGFAGALAELGLPQAQTPGALFAFNVGVELGQLGVLAVAFPVIQQFRRTAWFGPRGVPALSLGTALAGVFWFFDRV